MAIRALNEVFKLRLTGHGIHNVPALRWALACLADCADGDTLECYPGYQYIADFAQCDRGSAIQHVRALVALGLVEIIGRGIRGVNRYRLLLPFNPNWEAYERWLSENPKPATGGEVPPVDAVNLTAALVSRNRHTGGSGGERLVENPASTGGEVPPEPKRTGPTEPYYGTGTTNRAHAREGQAAQPAETDNGILHNDNVHNLTGPCGCRMCRRNVPASVRVG